MRTITLGIVPAPGLTSKIIEMVKENLKEILNKKVSQEIEWNIHIKVDQITGAAETVKEIMNQAINLKKINQWDYVISLTDLPIFYNKYIVLADTDSDEKAAQISLAAFGMFPTKAKVKKTLLQMTKELYHHHNGKDKIEFMNNGIGIKEKTKSHKQFNLLRKIFQLTSIERRKLKEKSNGTSVRFLIHPKWNGKIKLIAGMTVANSPWSIMPSFKKVIGLAFATGSYMLIFNTLWILSGIYGFFRFIILMLTAMIAMVIWIIFAHNLWERKHNYTSRKLRRMYNITTITTLSVSVIIFYVSMLLIFNIAVFIFVPKETFKTILDDEVGITDYARLAWLVTSAATVAGAIGAGLEDEESVREITYGYRQYIRSKKIQEDEESNKEG